MIQGYYYLHKNGELIYKVGTDCVADIRESDLARGLWPVDPTNREDAWSVLVEGLASGANKDRVKELAEKWHCDDKDAIIYAGFIDCVLGQEGNQKTATRKDFQNLQLSPCGFGGTYLEAMSDLCKQLGYKPAKMWGNSFASLLKSSDNPQMEELAL